VVLVLVLALVWDMAGRLASALRGNAHVLNFVAVGGAIVVPVVAFALTRAPPPERIEATLVSEHAEAASRGRVSGERVAAFWRDKRGAAEMDDVYAGLLRSGKSAMARQHELTGPLAATEAAGSPRVARMQALLTASPRRPGSVSSVTATSAAAVGAAATSAPGASTGAAPSSAAPTEPLAAVATPLPAEGKAAGSRG